MKSLWVGSVLGRAASSADTTERKDDVTLYIMHLLLVAPFERLELLCLAAAVDTTVVTVL